MKKIILAASLVLGMFLAYSAFGAGLVASQMPKAHAENNNGRDARVGIGADASVQVNSENNRNADSGESVEAQEKPEAETETETEEVETEQGDQNVQSTSSLKASIERRQNELEGEAASSSDRSKQEALKSNDQMRLAVHALLSSRTLLGGIGPEVSVLAQDLNNSVTSTVSAEAKVQSRNWLAKLFFGGDQQNSASLAGQVNQNLENIQKLDTLIASCKSCSVDLKTMLQSQLTLAQDEQVHLEALAKDQADSRGIFGAILRLFGR